MTVGVDVSKDYLDHCTRDGQASPSTALMTCPVKNSLAGRAYS